MWLVFNVSGEGMASVAMSDCIYIIKINGLRVFWCDWYLLRTLQLKNREEAPTYILYTERTAITVTQKEVQTDGKRF